jgi:hypothetical protein
MTPLFDRRCPGCTVHLVTPLDEVVQERGPGFLRLPSFQGRFHRLRDRTRGLTCHLCGTVLVRERRITVQTEPGGLWRDASPG